MNIKYMDLVEQGVSIKCKLFCKEQARTFSRVVIACHGFGGNKDNAITQKFAETVLPVHLDTAVLAFDWPCHGEDVKQKLLLDDCAMYLRLVVAYARNTLQAQSVFALGNSFGGYLLLNYIHTRENPFEKILLRCPAVNMYPLLLEAIQQQGLEDQLRKKDVPLGHGRKIRVSKTLMEQLQVQDITQWEYSAFAPVILILQGTKDETVSFDTVQAFARKNSLDFISIENADHQFREPSKTREVLDYTAEYFFG